MLSAGQQVLLKTMPTSLWSTITLILLQALVSAAHPCLSEAGLTSAICARLIWLVIVVVFVVVVVVVVLVVVVVVVV